MWSLGSARNGKVQWECGSSLAGELWDVSSPRRALHHHISPLHLLPALPGLCHRTCAGTRCCPAPELWNELPQEGWDPHSQGTHSAWVWIQPKWRLKLMPAQRECAAFCWLSQLVSQFPRMPAVCRRGWSSQAIRSKKTLSASLLFSSIYNYCVRELHNL